MQSSTGGGTEGGGGGGTYPPPPTPTPSPNTVEGYVVNSTNGGPVPGMIVYVDLAGLYWNNWTDNTGHFIFRSYQFVANIWIKVEVNGNSEDGSNYEFGVWTYDVHYDQWSGHGLTDKNGYLYKVINLQPAVTVNVPAAAFFSDTKYATLTYGLGTTSSFSHTLSFSMEGSGITTGYTTSVSSGYTFGCEPLTQFYVAKEYYANSYWDNDTQSVVSSGISSPTETADWGTLPTKEYLNLTNITSGYKQFYISYGTYGQYQYAETGSYTWSASAGVPFAIGYYTLWTSIKLDTTVTSTSDVTYTVDRRGDTNTSSILWFRAYTLGSLLNPADSPKVGVGGLELHVWDISGAG
jgi:hypothetical protein